MEFKIGRINEKKINEKLKEINFKNQYLCLHKRM